MKPLNARRRPLGGTAFTRPYRQLAGASNNELTAVSQNWRARGPPPKFAAASLPARSATLSTARIKPCTRPRQPAEIVSLAGQGVLPKNGREHCNPVASDA